MLRISQHSNYKSYQTQIHFVAIKKVNLDFDKQHECLCKIYWDLDVVIWAIEFDKAWVDKWPIKYHFIKTKINLLVTRIENLFKKHVGFWLCWSQDDAMSMVIISNQPGAIHTSKIQSNNIFSKCGQDIL